jgi:FkbM family methyltransferase
MELLTHIENVAKYTNCIPESHKQYLIDLKKRGFEPKVIYDIGSAVLHWANLAHKLWPDAEIIAFDAFKPLEILYLNSPYKHYIGLLGNDDDKEVKYYVSNEHFCGNSYYKEHDEKVFPVSAFEMQTMNRLDTIVERNGFPKPDFVKIDVQGAEKDIISGGLKTLANAKHMIVEMQSEDYNIGAPKVTETLPYIESLGWKCTAPLICNYGPDGDYGFEKNILP